MYDSVSDEFCLLMNVVWGKVVSECIVDKFCEIFPLSFIVIDESFSFAGFGMFLGYEYCGEYRDMIRWELCEGCQGWRVDHVSWDNGEVGRGSLLSLLVGRKG